MTYQPDAKTLIRHAMQALDDELGVNAAWQFNKRLLEVFNDIRRYEDRDDPLAGREVVSMGDLLQAYGGIDQFLRLQAPKKGPEAA